MNLLRIAIVLGLAAAGEAPAPRAFLCADYGRGKVVWEVFEKQKLGTIAAVHCFDGEGGLR